MAVRRGYDTCVQLIIEGLVQRLGAAEVSDLLLAMVQAKRSYEQLLAGTSNSSSS